MNARISDTLYAKYVAERASAKILENEHGFIVYRIDGKECFIVEMFTRSESRKSVHTYALMQRLEEIAKESGCRVITSNVLASDEGHGDTLIFGLKSGFKVVAANNGIMILVKEMGEKPWGD